MIVQSTGKIRVDRSPPLRVDKQDPIQEIIFGME